MNRIPVLLALVALLVSGRASAQFSQRPDSLHVSSAVDFRPVQLVAPGAFIAAGTAVHILAHNTLDVGVRDAFMRWRGDAPGFVADDYVQYLPVALDLGLAFAGVESRHGFVDRLISVGIGAVSLVVVTESVKLLVDSPRPDGSDNRSFPSGHTVKAFFGAELVRQEYGGWWGAGAYAVATAVAVSRIYNDAHWFSDVLAGAGVGILCAYVGNWLLEPARNLLGIRDSASGPVVLSPSLDPYSGAVCASLSFRF